MPSPAAGLPIASVGQGSYPPASKAAHNCTHLLNRHHESVHECKGQHVAHSTLQLHNMLQQRGAQPRVAVLQVHAGGGCCGGRLDHAGAELFHVCGAAPTLEVLCSKNAGWG